MPLRRTARPALSSAAGGVILRDAATWPAGPPPTAPGWATIDAWSRKETWTPRRCSSTARMAPTAVLRSRGSDVRGEHRYRAALVLLGLLAACRSAPPPPYPGSLVEMTVRVLPARAKRVAASVDATAPAALRSGASAGEWYGAIAVSPGPHAVKIEAFDAASALLGETVVTIAAAPGDPVDVDATIAAALPTLDRAVVTAIVAPRNSVVVGDRMLLQARGGPVARVTFAWTATPPGCGTFANSGAASTEWTATAPGACTVTLTAAAAGQTDRRSVSVVVRTHGRSYQYPLQVAPGGRHIIEQRGPPSLVQGETAWLALVNLTEAEQERYLADRSAKGFNLIELMLTNHDYTSSPTPPANRAGERPFKKPGDFSTPDDAYFDRAAAFVDRAAAHGIVVLLAPNYLGFDGGREGWWQELNSPMNTRSVCAG